MSTETGNREKKALLAIDARNGSISVGVREGNAWASRFRIGALAGKSAREYRSTIVSLVNEDGISESSIGRAIVSSVVPSLTAAMCEAAASIAGTAPLLVGPGMKTGMKILTDYPQEVGGDIVCESIAAFERFKSACIVIAFGNALVITAVSGNGELLGASIVQGPEKAAEGLARSSALIPEVKLDMPKNAIGKNTTESVRSGIVIGYTGLIDALVDHFEREMGVHAMIAGTGGPIGAVIAPTRGFDAFDQWLSLEGLSIIESRNIQKR